MPDLSYIIYQFILPVLEFCRHFFGNYGWAIIAVTILFKVVLLPFSIKQAISTKNSQEKIKKIQPEIDRIKERFEKKKNRHKDEPQKLLEIKNEFQKELLDITRQNGAFNPLGGCLPLLLQFPILIALYWTFVGSPFQPSILTIPLKIQAVSLNTAWNVVSQTGDIVGKLLIEDLKNNNTTDNLRFKILDDNNNLIGYAENQSQEKKQETDNNKIPENLENYNKSKVVNYVDSKGRLGRYQLETNIIGENLALNKNYKISLKKLDGKASIKPKNLYWRINRKVAERSLHLERKDLHSNVIIPSWAHNKINLDFNKKTSELNINISKNLDIAEEFQLEAILWNSRANQSFFFIKDLGRLGVYNSKEKEIHWDILILLLLFVGSMYITTSLMSSNTSAMPTLEPSQEKLQKQMQMFLPLMSVVFFLFIPLPGAVFLYLTVSNVFQIAQTYFVNKIPVRISEKI
jgi:YidC/Oxa1 family membrane protein insertase